MSDRPIPRSDAHPPLHRAVLRLATAAAAAATLVWSGLFYSALSHHNAATPATAVAPTPSSTGPNAAATKAAPTAAPLVTRTS